jgi:hypothetical protein
MNLLVQINQWIDNPNRNYAEGLNIYDKFKANPKCDAFFKANLANPSGAAVNMLYQKMIGIALKIKANPKFLEQSVIKSSTAKPIAHSAATPKAKPVVSAPKGLKASSATPLTPDSKLNNLPPELADAANRIKELMPIKGGLQAKLKALKPEQQSEAKAIVDNLLEVDNEMRKLWEQIDNYKGQDPKKDVDPLAVPIEELRRQLKVTKSSLSRTEGKIPTQKKTNPKLAAKSEAKVEEYNLRIKSLEEQIRKFS